LALSAESARGAFAPGRGLWTREAPEALSRWRYYQ
jgi:hypothetical protein